MSELALGIKSFLEGFGYFRKNTYVRNLSLIPIFLCIFFLTFGMAGVILYIDDLLNLVAAEWMMNLNAYLKSLIYILASLGIFIVVYFVVLVLVSILAIPVCERITDKVFEIKGVKRKDETFLQNIRGTFRMLKASLAKLILIGVASLFVLVASFLPVLYPVAMYLTFMLVTWDVLDFSFDREGKNFKERLNFIQKNWLALTGFSLCLGLLLFIPFVHFILLPVAVCGAACLYLNISKKSELS